MLHKLNFFILFFLFFNGHNSTPIQNNDLSKKNLKGKVKRTISHYYKPIHGSDKIINEELTDTFIYTYNKKGNELSFDDGIYQTISKYDKDGFKINYHLRDDSKIYQSVKINKDSLGLKISEIVYNANEDIIGKRIYKREENQIEVTEFNKSEHLITKKISDYDQHNNKTKELKFDHEGNKIVSISFTYNENNLLINKFQFNFKPKVTYSETKYKYNDYGDVVYERRTAGRNIMVYKYDYEYDNKRNWIKKIEYENDTAIRIQKREIKYFD